MKTIDHKLKDGVVITGFERDHITNMIAKNNYYYEGGMLDFIKKEIPKGLMVDVGANIGNHSIFFAKYCATNVIAFEPFPETHKILVKNIKQNGIKNIMPIEFGLSDEAKFVYMESLNENNVGMAKISETGTTEIYVVTFDFSAKDVIHEPITLIKIDNEGYEVKTVLGMIETIKEHKPALFIECQTVEAFNDIFAIINPLGYIAVNKFNPTPTYYFKHINSK